MSDTKSEAREFWINTELHEWEVDIEPMKPRYSDNMDLIVHVIEMSSYQDLKAKHERVLQMLEVAEKALKQIAGPRKKDGSYFYSIPEIQRMGDDGADTDNARYALEKINKIESLK